MCSKRRLLLRGGLLACVLASLTTGVVLAAGPFVEPDAVALQTFTGEQVGDSFGWAAENLGDLDGDGVNEFITSAPSWGENGPSAGRVYVFSGKGGGPLNTVTGDAFDQLGYSVSTAGDVNHDGVPDYIMGGPGLPNAPVPFKGRALVYSGATHQLLLDLPGEVGTRFGAAVAGAGDVNHDGYADLIVGAPRAGTTLPRSGRVYLFSGKDGSVLWMRDGQWELGTLGLAVGLVGDVNGDGVPDQVAGAPGAGRRGKGEAYVLSGVDGAIIHTLRPVGQPGNPTKSFGLFFTTGMGDVNRDGVPDIFVGDWNATHLHASGTGRAYVFSGKTGKRLHLYNAEQPGDGFGVGRGIGDVDGDGAADLIIAAYTSSAGAPAGGKAYIYSGRRHKLLRTFTSNVAGDLLGVDALSIGDVNGDGLADYILTTGNGGIEKVYIVAGTPLQSHGDDDDDDEDEDSGLEVIE